MIKIETKCVMRLRSILAGGLFLMAASRSAGGTNTAVNIAGGTILGGGSASYSVGWRFQPTLDLVVTALGVYDANGGGLSSTHTVRVYNVTAGTVVTTASVSATTPGEAAGGYSAHFVAVTPFTLTAGQTYLIAQNRASDDYRYDVAISPGPNLGYETGVGVAGNLPISSASFNIVRANSYFGPNFKYLTSGATLAISQPLPRAVYQRDSNNVARVAIAGVCDSGLDRIEARAATRAGFTGATTEWTVLATSPGSAYSNDLPVAGGWYDIEVRAISGGTAVATSRVERVGVGEIFITAGQSNAGNYGAPAQSPADDRVNALNLNTRTWQAANDPQPYASGSNGSPWPDFASLLAVRTETPVAVVAVAVGATSVGQWVPGTGTLYPRIALAISALKPYGGFRAILWHQGESDSLSGTSAAKYADRLNAIIAQSRADAGGAVPWGVALASWHPDATADSEAKIVDGQWLVITNTAGVFKGATTDPFHTLGWLSDSVHFNALGLRDHGRQWVDAVWRAVLSDDRDGDGMPDLWMLTHFGHAEGTTNDYSSAANDADGDGASNLDECRATTDPRDPDKYLRLSDITISNGLVRVTWPTVRGRTYHVGWTSAIANQPWAGTSSLLPVYADRFFLEDASALSDSVRFYRLNVEP